MQMKLKKETGYTLTNSLLERLGSPNSTRSSLVKGR